MFWCWLLSEVWHHSRLSLNGILWFWLTQSRLERKLRLLTYRYKPWCIRIFNWNLVIFVVAALWCSIVQIIFGLLPSPGEFLDCQPLLLLQFSLSLVEAFLQAGWHHQSGERNVFLLGYLYSQPSVIWRLSFHILFLETNCPCTTEIEGRWGLISVCYYLCWW